MTRRLFFILGIWAWFLCGQVVRAGYLRLEGAGFHGSAGDAGLARACEGQQFHGHTVGLSRHLFAIHALKACLVDGTFDFRMKHRYTNIRGRARLAHSGGPYESQLEREDWINWVMSPEVESVVLQAPRVRRRKWRYTADICVRFRDPSKRPLAIEIKQETELRDDESLRAKHEEIREVMDKAGYDFCVRSEPDIYGRDHSALRFLLWARVQEPVPEKEDWIVAQVAAAGELTVGDLLGRYSEDRIAQLEFVYLVWRVAAHHRVQATPLDRPLNELTVLRAVG